MKKATCGCVPGYSYCETYYRLRRELDDDASVLEQIHVHCYEARVDLDAPVMWAAFEMEYDNGREIVDYIEVAPWGLERAKGKGFMFEARPSELVEELSTRFYGVFEIKIHSCMKHLSPELGRYGYEIEVIG
jgi:hypothetical protein